MKKNNFKRNIILFLIVNVVYIFLFIILFYKINILEKECNVLREYIEFVDGETQNINDIIEIFKNFNNK